MTSDEGTELELADMAYSTAAGKSRLSTLGSGFMPVGNQHDENNSDCSREPGDIVRPNSPAKAERSFT